MKRRAFTATDLVVSIAIVGVLVALLIPAVQSARQAARRSQCAANLRQIGIATGAYESAHGMFPPGGSLGASLHVAILPFLDQQRLYDRYDNVRRNDSQVRTVVVPLFLCPGDPAGAVWPRGDSPPAATSYAGNSGTGVLNYGYNGMYRYLVMASNIPLRRSGPIRAMDVTRGLSHTAAVAEILHADGTFGRLRVDWNTPTTFYDPSQYGEFAEYCAAIPPVPSDYGWLGDSMTRGLPWTDGNIGCTLYNHVLAPNQPSCFSGTDVQAGIYSAASTHNGGVNLLYGDGHLGFIGSGIDINVWRGTGSRLASDMFP